MNEFIIVFRESLEACLIVGIIFTLLEKNNLIKEIKQLWLGVIAALIASVIVAVILNNIKQSVGNASYTALFEAVFKTPQAFVLGNEGAGLTKPALAIADTCLHVPMHEHSESLNVAVTGSLIAYEILRQKTLNE